MLDLETMGVSPDAAIVQIGAVGFNGDWPSLSPYTESFFCRINLASAMAGGGVVDASTILWWLGRSDAARAELTTLSLLSMGHALDDFAAWWSALCDSKTQLWGNGADFDNVILGSAYRRAGKKQPWGRFTNRCFRTLKAEHPGIAYVKPVLAHVAIADATAQAEHWLKIRSHQRGETSPATTEGWAPRQAY